MGLIRAKISKPSFDLKSRMMTKMNKSEGSLCEGGHTWKVGWESVLPRAGKTLLVEMDRRGPQRGTAHPGAGRPRLESWVCLWTSHCSL